MSRPALQSERRLTWEDYLKSAEGERWEIVDGVVYDMSPTPAIPHQVVAREIGGVFYNYFKGKKCQPFAAPTAVKLSRHDVVEPDLLVVCDPRQIKPTHIEGAPALVVEILSPSSHGQDRVRKMRLYAKAGVKEYWIVTPFPACVEVFLLDGATYRMHGAYGKDEEMTSATFPDLKLRLAEIFDFPLEPEEAGLRLVKESPGPGYRVKKKRT